MEVFKSRLWLDVRAKRTSGGFKICILKQRQQAFGAQKDAMLLANIGSSLYLRGR